MVKSATSRNSIGVARSLVSAIIRIWPMIELIGPMCGETFGGSWSRTRLSRSVIELAVAIDVGAPVELDIDDRQPDARHRAHARHARHAVHLRLDREADQQLDLGRREALRLGHDGDGRPVEVGQHVDRQPRARLNVPNTTSTRLSASTSRRLRSDWVTRNVNIASRHRTWSRSSAPCTTTRWPGSRPASDQHALAVERLDAHRARLEPLRAGVLVDEVLRRSRCAPGCRAGSRCPRFCSPVVANTVTNWPARKPAGLALDREVHRDRLVAVGEARAAERKRQRAGRSPWSRRPATGPATAIEAQRLDPELRRIDDLEDHRVGLRHLARDRRAVGDHAGTRARSAPPARGGSVSSEARRSFRPCSSSLRFVELHARHRAARRQASRSARRRRCDDGDLLVELALALAHVGHVDRLHRRRHIGEHVALS